MDSEKRINRDGLQMEPMWYQMENFNRKSRNCVLEDAGICSPLKNIREEGRDIFYLDETWVDSFLTFNVGKAMKLMG
jgi:hypothetical protein